MTLIEFASIYMKLKCFEIWNFMNFRRYCWFLRTHVFNCFYERIAGTIKKSRSFVHSLSEKRVSKPGLFSGVSFWPVPYYEMHFFGQNARFWRFFKFWNEYFIRSLLNLHRSTWDCIDLKHEISCFFRKYRWF